MCLRRVLSRMYGRKRDEIIGSWIKLHEELHNLYSSPKVSIRWQNVSTDKTTNMRKSNNVIFHFRWKWPAYLRYTVNRSVLDFVLIATALLPQCGTSASIKCWVALYQVPSRQVLSKQSVKWYSSDLGVDHTETRMCRVTHWKKQSWIR
jgi:hypothetical protein